jgi:hypothetical protein
MLKVLRRKFSPPGRRLTIRQKQIPMPLNMQQVQHVSHRAHGLRHGRDRADLRGISRSNPGSVSSLSGGTVLLGDYGDDDAEIEEDYVHLQVCNSCGEVRFPYYLLSLADSFFDAHTLFQRYLADCWRQVPMPQLPFDTQLVQLGT